MLLARDQRSIILGAEHFAERRDVTEKRTCWLDILDQAPQFDERVLHRRRGEQQDWRGAQNAANTVRHQSFIRTLVVNPVAIVSLVQSSEDLVSFVDNGEVEGRHCAECCRASLTASELAANQIHGWRQEARPVLTCLDTE